MSNGLAWIIRRADNVAVALLAAMFASFLLQVISRYAIRHPLGWTIELCLITWVWLVFWGCAFLLRDREHVTFDILYLSSPKKVRRIFALISALAMTAALLVSLPASLDYIDFLKIKKSAIMRIPMQYIYSVYAVFAVALILRGIWRTVQMLRGEDPDGQTPEAPR